MGWASRYMKQSNISTCHYNRCVHFYSGDPLSNMSLTFDSKEEAIAFAVKSGKFKIKHGVNFFSVPVCVGSDCLLLSICVQDGGMK